MRLSRTITLAVALSATIALSVLPIAGADDAAAGLVGVHNDGGRFADAEGRTVVLRGVNAVDKTGWHGSLAEPILTPADVGAIAAMGFNHVRLGTTWASIEHEQGVYDDAYLDQLVGVLDELHRAGLSAVVDMHQDVWSEGIGYDGAPSWADPQCNVTTNPDLGAQTGTWFAQYASPEVNVAWANFWHDGYGELDPHCTGPIQTRFVAMWRHVAERLAGHPAVIGYDLLNEPWPSAPPGVFEQTQLLPFYERVVAAIREVDDDTMIFFGPPLYSPAVPTVAVTPPDPNSAFAPHIYTETMFSGGFVTTGARTDELALNKDLAEGAHLGVPVWIGEWGEVNDDTYTTQMYDLFDRYRASDAFWKYNQHPGGNNIAGHEAAHTRPYVEAYAGDTSWTFDGDDGSFVVTTTVEAGTHQLILVVPTSLGLSTSDPSVQLNPELHRATWTVVGPGTFSVSLTRGD